MCLLKLETGGQIRAPSKKRIIECGWPFTVKIVLIPAKIPKNAKNQPACHQSLTGPLAANPNPQKPADLSPPTAPIGFVFNSGLFITGRATLSQRAKSSNHPLNLQMRIRS
jgi:hypothetical protein